MKRIITLLLVFLSLQMSAQCIQKVGAGSSCTFVIKTDGTLWAWGRNNYGQLGIGSVVNATAKTRVGTASNWQSVEGGQFHTAAIKADGSLWTWGFNASGQLGINSTTNSSVPVQVSGGNVWKSVAAGYDHTVAIRTDGSMYGWGLNDHGQVGDGTGTNRNLPVRIGTGTNWASVAAGNNVTVAVKTDGTLWGWGESSQVGDGTTADKRSPVQLGTDTNWKSVSRGVTHTLALKTDGTLWAWGTNGKGQLGIGSTAGGLLPPVQVGTDTDWESIKAGFFSSMGRKTDGTIWSWGQGGFYQLGQGTSTASVLVPTQIGTDTDWQFITIGSSSLFNQAVKNDGTLWTWGYNNYSQLGDGLTAALPVPTFISCPASISLTETACDSYTWATNGTTYTQSGLYVDPVTNNDLHLTINYNTATTIDETACETYTWDANGTTYTESGTYTNTTSNASGCTDTKTLHLTINRNTASSIDQMACESYTWDANGTTYTESGTYTNITTNASGCTETTTLHLTIDTNTTTTINEAACETYTWDANGTTYTESGTYTNVITGASGCTNTTTLHLTINHNTEASIDETACSYYIWAANGTIYTESGTYTNITTSASGCTHTATLNLIVDMDSLGTQEEAACDSYLWSVNGVTYTESGTYTNTVTTPSGCVHLTELYLTINHSTASTATETACGSYTWAANGNIYTDSGTYTNVTTNASGCTDTATLNLTINTVEMPIGESNQSVTADVAAGATLANLVVSPTTILWYASLAEALTHENPIATTTALTDGNIYYAVNAVDGCYSDPLAISVSVTLASDVFNDNRFSIYPNPTSGLIYIKYAKDITTISVVNLLGQQVMAKSINNREATVDISALDRGTYFLKINADQQVKTVKIIKE